MIEAAQLFRWRTAGFRAVLVRRPDGSMHYETPIDGDAKGFLDLELVRSPRLIKVELKIDSSVRPEQKEWIAAYAGIPGVEVYVWRPNDWDEIVRILT